MADANQTQAKKELTAAEAAKAVGCKHGDVLAFKDYGTHVVVVTRAGQKLSSQDAEAKKEAGTKAAA